MSLRRLLRLFFGLVIAFVLLPIVLPLIGVSKSHFLPPSWVYQQATGKTTGKVTKVYHENSNNPFRIGEKMYFVDYQFVAMQPDKLKYANKPFAIRTKYFKVYKNTCRVTDRLEAKPGQLPAVKYEITNPDISGITSDDVGRACRSSSNVLSGWLWYVALAIFLGFMLMLLFDKIGAREDI